MQYVIVYRNTRNGSVGFVTDNNGEIAVFDNLDLAVTAAETTPILRVYPFQIIELDIEL
jgi:hypothetical protein